MNKDNNANSSTPSPLRERVGVRVIILGDGMADWPCEELGGKTLLQAADTPHFDRLAREGRCGQLKTVPDGFHPGSEVANSSILGYDQHIVYEGRGPLEAASIGVKLEEGDLAMRCNLVCLDGEILKNHSCGRLETEDADVLIKYLDEHLGTDRVHFYTGVQYRHLLVIKGGDKHLDCTPPHDIPLQTWRDKLPKAKAPSPVPPRGEAIAEASDKPTDTGISSLPLGGAGRGAVATAALLQDLILKSQTLLAEHPLNKARIAAGQDPANSIWPWGGGYRPKMVPLTETFPQLKRGAVITAVDLIRGIGRYAGLEVINVEGATGLFDTNYEGKAQACIDALEGGADFVYVHVEASDEAGHDGNLELKLQTIENLDHRLVAPILDWADRQSQPVSIALLPDHPTPVAHRTHTAEPVPFAIWHRGIQPDAVQTFDEVAARDGSCGLIEGDAFIQLFMQA